MSNRRDIKLAIFLTGMHGLTTFAVPKEAPPGATILHGGRDLGGLTGQASAAAMADIAAAAAKVLAEFEPDRLVVVGDRLDMLPVVISATALNIPIVHLHGGEITAGAIDDRIRHAVTKLAHLHCAATVDAAERIARMGEDAWRISVTGAPGLDTLRLAPTLSAEDLADALGVSASDLPHLRIATIHPETNAAEPAAIIHPILEALAERPAPTLFTAPNSDPGGVVIREAIEAFVRQHAWAGIKETLGSRLYPAALRQARLMIGNSSSGIIEAGAFGLPVIDIGNRQAGRLHGGQVWHCAADTRAILATLDLVMAKPRMTIPDSPYGDGHAAERVVEVITEPHDRRRLIVKSFADGTETAFTCPWAVPVTRMSVS